MKITSKALLCGMIATFTFFACKKNNSTGNNETVSLQDSNFIHQASLSNTAEIQAGALADSTADSSMVRAFGQQMVTDHTTAQNDLKALGSSLNIVVTDSVDSAHVALIQTLKGLTGRAFDSVYILSQIKDHQTAITNFQQEINTGNRTQVINYANQYLPKLQMHLQMADSIANQMNIH